MRIVRIPPKECNLSKPWISRGIRISIRKKTELYYSGDMAKYKLYRNKILTMSRLKNTWKGIDLLINRKKKDDNVITALKRPGNG